MKRVMLLLAGLLLAGCDTISNSHAPERTPVSVAAGRGRVLLSTGASARCFAFVTHLMIRPADPANRQHRISTVQVDSYVVKSDFDDHKGSINLLTLNEGDYIAYPWIANGRVRPIQTPVYNFHVTAGVITYIGEYYMPVSCGLNTESQFRDTAARDINLMRQRNPDLVDTPVTKDLAQFDHYR